MQSQNKGKTVKMKYLLIKSEDYNKLVLLRSSKKLCLGGSIMDLTKIAENSDLLITIQTNYESLRKSEKKVADYVLNHHEEIIHLTISELASKVSVSEPTIIRFCKKLGLSGYQNMKIQLAQIKKKPLAIIHEQIDTNDTIKEVANKVITSHIIALNETLKQLDFDTLSQVIKILTNSKSIDFYGLGGSGTVAIDVENKFLRTGLNTHAYVDSHIQLMRTSLLNQEDTIVIFSNTGNTKHFINLLEIAKKRKVSSILITSSPVSSLAKLADYVLSAKAKEIRYKKEPSSSRIAMMSIMDIVVTYVALIKQEQYIENIYLTREALSKDKLNND